MSTREWNNSIYQFNKNTLALIPQATISTLRLIKGYFHTYNLTIENKLRKTRLLPRLRRLSSHKIYVSNGEFKHTNDKVIITLYTYNRQKFNYLSLLNARYLSLQKLNNRLYLIKSQGLEYLKKANRGKYDIIKILNVFFFNKAKNKEITAYTESFYVNDYFIKFYINWVKKSLQKINFYLYYKQLLYLNESLYKYTYLQALKIYLEKIYNKKVEFNLINVKCHYFNSDILSESITLKITKNRKKLLNYLKKLILKVKIYKTDKNVSYKADIYKLNLIKTRNDPVENLLNNKHRPVREDSKKVVLDEIKYKRLGGVRLEASGRLTKRYTASRSVTILKYKGNLINSDSSYKGLSTVLLKGNLRSNIQYSKLKSKTRVGSFGIKSWVSGN